MISQAPTKLGLRHCCTKNTTCELWSLKLQQNSDWDNQFLTKLWNSFLDLSNSNKTRIETISSVIKINPNIDLSSSNKTRIETLSNSNAVTTFNDLSSSNKTRIETLNITSFISINFRSLELQQNSDWDNHENDCNCIHDVISQTPTKLGLRHLNC